MVRNFTKNDASFVCVRCGAKVKNLGYTSRDHCPKCLTSLHVDNFPGDRQNECKGLMTPVGITSTNQKGLIIQYKCEKCGALHNNKTATDDNLDAILSVSNQTYPTFFITLTKNKT